MKDTRIRRANEPHHYIPHCNKQGWHGSVDGSTAVEGDTGPERWGVGMVSGWAETAASGEEKAQSHDPPLK